MVIDCLTDCLKNLESELRYSENQRIRSYFVEFDQYVDKNQKNIVLQKLITSALIKTMILGTWNQLYFEDKIIEQFEYLLSHIHEFRKTMTIKVSLHNYSEHLYRVIKLPYMMKLDDFCYSILASFEVQECKQFSIEINKIDRYGYGQEIGDNEMDQFIPAYQIDEYSQIKLYYDFDDTYIFDIDVLDIEDSPTNTIRFIDGRGYGVWENGKKYLNMYFQDKQNFLNYINDNGLDIEDFYVDQFDITFQNYKILEDINLLKMRYNVKYEERKIFYEYLPFLLFKILCRKLSYKKYVFFNKNSVLLYMLMSSQNTNKKRKTILLNQQTSTKTPRVFSFYLEILLKR